MEKKRLDIIDLQAAKPAASGERAFIGVLFLCCNVYSRVYLAAATNRTIARCPRCGRRAAFDSNGQSR